MSTRCHNCTREMDRVDDVTWICIPCRVTEYFISDRPVAELPSLRDFDCDTRMTG